ncbi:MAG: YmdB family metallophosphoesterase, partial [Campylobacterota bacterium]|nr:YmdB family metallophosphoesterase [Campylobacterota bacterium]
MPDELRILFIGDIVGKPGRKVFSYFIPSLIEEYKTDLVIVNMENIAGGFGITVKTYRELENLADVFTSGNHVWDKKETLENIDEMQKLLRPLNVHPSLPGR